MRPELFQIFGVPVYAYRTLLAFSFVACTLLAVRESRTRPGGVELSPLVGIWAMFGALIGAHGFYILQYGSVFDLWRAFFVWEGGLVFYGGLIGGVAAAGSHLALRKVPYLNGADSAAPYVALGEAITRVGCFLNGCCFGEVCQLPWAVTFPAHGPAFDAQVGAGQLAQGAPHALPVHPTQLYMTFGLIAICLLLKSALVRPRPAGMVFFGYVFLYGLLRFLVEMVRGDSARSVWGLTVSGAISAAFVAVGIAAFAYFLRRPRSLPE
jgi:phosphatidylglycerol:prolipoprotein diacylglycerol transferase